MNKPYPLYIAVKPRYFDSTILCLDPKENKLIMTWVCYKIVTSHDPVLVYPYVLALAIERVQLMGLKYITSYLGYCGRNRTDKEEVITKGQENFKLSCSFYS